MDIKEELYRNIVLKMGNVLSEEDNKQLRRILSAELENYDIFHKDYRELPAAYSSRNTMLIQMFIAAKSIEGRSSSTLEAYKFTIGRFIGERDIDLLNVNTNDFRSYFFRLEQLGNSLTSIDNNRRNLNSFYQWLATEEYIAHNPLLRIKRIKTQIKVKYPYSNIDIVKFRDACVTIREKAILDLLLSTGIRNEELCGIKLVDTDFFDKSILINGKGNKQRVVYMSDACLLHLQQYLQWREDNGIESEWLICSERKRKVNGKMMYTKLATGGLRYIIKTLAERAGVPDSYVHKFRRTFCTTMLDYMDIVTVQGIMGHESIATTKRYAPYDKIRAKHEFAKLRLLS